MQAQDTKVKVADLVAETLEQLGIQHAFGIIGVTVSPSSIASASAI